uniref:Uncharacterized protein AlNc14C366G11063 n=1 Tax=Albugo laibachii Nc14 TaxID=890382 RepID=F0WXZ4_9STRA|nr:conserved hypothetical protein [Albugo laibachii Nc14]|eukprot:CCA26342.1 conserved hypothetical protein [Albugo laibachii Nc14]
MNELTACAHALLHGVPDKARQKQADQWICEFKNTTAAWSICIEAIQGFPNDTTLLFVAMQILRQKIEKEWSSLAVEEQNFFEMTFVEFLECTATKYSAIIPAFVRRIACDTLALIAVRRSGSWKVIFSRFYRIASGDHGREYCTDGLITLLEILGAIPSRLHLGDDPDQNEVIERALNVLHGEKQTVRLVALSAMESFPELNSIALQCIENWVVGCIPRRPTFGLDITDVCSNCDLLNKLFDIMMGGSEFDSMLVTSIMTDILSAGPRDSSVHESHHLHRMHHQIINQTTEMLFHVLERLQTEACARNHIYRGIAQILSIVAMQYLSVICQEVMATHQHITRKLMQALLILTAFPDTETAQPILEFWYFFLDDTSSSSWKLLSHSYDEAAIVDLLNNVVRALLSQCHLPKHLLLAVDYSTNETSHDVSAFRSEIADTLLNMFKHWPLQNGPEYCFLQLAAMMEDDTDLATIESILYVLDRLLELFDVDISERMDPNHSIAHGTIPVLEQVLLQCFRLPDHCVVFFGITRYLKSLLQLQELSAGTKSAAISFLMRGLAFSPRMEVITPLLFEMISKSSSTLSNEERGTVAQTLSQHCHLQLHLDCHLDQVGDLLATLYQLIGMQDNQESFRIPQQLLFTVKHRLCSPDPDIAAKALYLMGRLVTGITDPARRVLVLVDAWHESCQALTQCRNHPMLHHYIFPFVKSCLFLMNGNDFEKLKHILNLCLTENSTCFHQVILILKTMYSMLPPHADNFKSLANSAFSRCTSIMRIKLGFASSYSDQKITEHILQLSNGDSTAAIVETELPEYFKLAQMAFNLPADANTDCDGLFEQTLRLGCVILACDHKIQPLDESACKCIVECIIQQFGSSVERNTQVIEAIMPVVLSNLLAFLHPYRSGYTKKSIWDSLYRLRFSSNVSSVLQNLVAETCLWLLSKQIGSDKLRFLPDKVRLSLLQVLSKRAVKIEPNVTSSPVKDWTIWQFGPFLVQMIRCCRIVPNLAHIRGTRRASRFSTSSAQYPRSFLSHVKSQKFSGYGIGMACLTLSLATQLVQLRMQLNEANETIQKFKENSSDSKQPLTCDSSSDNESEEGTLMDGCPPLYDGLEKVRSESNEESREMTPLKNRKKVVLS